MPDDGVTKGARAPGVNVHCEDCGGWTVPTLQEAFEDVRAHELISNHKAHVYRDGKLIEPNAVVEADVPLPIRKSEPFCLRHPNSRRCDECARGTCAIALVPGESHDCPNEGCECHGACEPTGHTEPQPADPKAALRTALPITHISTDATTHDSGALKDVDPESEDLELPGVSAYTAGRVRKDLTACAMQNCNETAVGEDHNGNPLCEPHFRAYVKTRGAKGGYRRFEKTSPNPVLTYHPHYHHDVLRTVVGNAMRENPEWQAFVHRRSAQDFRDDMAERGHDVSEHLGNAFGGLTAMFNQPEENAMAGAIGRALSKLPQPFSPKQMTEALQPFSHKLNPRSVVTEYANRHRPHEATPPAPPEVRAKFPEEIHPLVDEAHAHPNYGEFHARVVGRHFTDHHSDFPRKRWGQIVSAYANEPHQSLAEWKRNYGVNDPLKWDEPEAYRASRPSTVTIYAAKPIHLGDEIEPGDDVHLSPYYAELSAEDDSNPQQVVTKQVSHNDLVNQGVDASHWTYSPKSMRDAIGNLKDFHSKIHPIRKGRAIRKSSELKRALKLANSMKMEIEKPYQGTTLPSGDRAEPKFGGEFKVLDHKVDPEGWHHIKVSGNGRAIDVAARVMESLHRHGVKNLEHKATRHDDGSFTYSVKVGDAKPEAVKL